MSTMRSVGRLTSAPRAALTTVAVLATTWFVMLQGAVAQAVPPVVERPTQQQLERTAIEITIGVIVVFAFTAVVSIIWLVRQNQKRDRQAQ